MIKINDAAKQLAVTPITIRRGIRAGTIKVQKKQRGAKAFSYLLSPDEASRLKRQRGNDLVHEQLNNSEQVPNQDDEQVKSKSNSGVDGLVELVREQNATIAQLQQELRSVSEIATMFQEKNEMLQGQVQKLLRGLHCRSRPLGGRAPDLEFGWTRWHPPLVHLRRIALTTERTRR